MEKSKKRKLLIIFIISFIAVFLLVSFFYFLNQIDKNLQYAKESGIEMSEDTKEALKNPTILDLFYLATGKIPVYVNGEYTGYIKLDA